MAVDPKIRPNQFGYRKTIRMYDYRDIDRLSFEGSAVTVLPRRLALSATPSHIMTLARCYNAPNVAMAMRSDSLDGIRFSPS